MKLFQQLRSVAASAGLSGLLLLAPSQAYGATASAPGIARAEVNGQTYSAIAVGNITYLEWQALQVFGTPYQYLGDGRFAVTGGTIAGVVYHGNTYLPWDSVATKVKASPLKGGGFNFTAIALPHQYHLVVVTPQKALIGSPDPYEVLVEDGGKLVPKQAIQLTLTGGSYASGYNGQKQIALTTDANGTWIGGINDTTVESVEATVTWRDPLGNLHTQGTSITFSNPVPTQPMVPVGDTVVANVPVSTFQNAIFFNAQGGGQDILFQLDTGAYEPLVSKQVAQVLGLRNLGNLTVTGVGGNDPAYNSQMTLTIGGQTFGNIPCLVDERYTGTPLLGYGFFTGHGYDLLISQKNQMMTILK